MKTRPPEEKIDPLVASPFPNQKRNFNSPSPPKGPFGLKPGRVFPPHFEFKKKNPPIEKKTPPKNPPQNWGFRAQGFFFFHKPLKRKVPLKNFSPF
ncbi:hypothetical protein EBI_26347 [Enterocytozoon bieneusi H348]|nr:hypothetical protein EBI_26347 [Enterocytozoon bieneusi H348]|eukprot:XP_002651168.1 hypothetical protein EBI_26347 [Enterocytozoon bieneusi H348]